MADMTQVWLDYKEVLNEVEREIEKNLDSKVTLINEVARYTLMSGGKRIRPLLLVISAQLCPSRLNTLSASFLHQQAITLGSVVEFIHTATLLHDDVIDNAKTRRGRLAARNLHGNQASILVGDFLYTLAVRRVVGMENHEMNNLLSATCGMMTEGETWQLAHVRDFDLTEEQYLKIVEYKTASLISAACRLGGIVAGASATEKEALSSFGYNLGMAFQLADDTLDYIADPKRFGKSLGQDIKEGKMTLPLIHLLLNGQKKEKERLIAVIQEGKPQKELSFILGLMERYGSIAYSKKKAAAYVRTAKDALMPFEDSAYRQTLCTVADYAIARDH